MSYDRPLRPTLTQSWDAAMTSDVSDATQPQHEAPAVLRERARRARHMARNVNDEAASRSLHDYADELDARATMQESPANAAPFI
jgi:hypothetical protein